MEMKSKVLKDIIQKIFQVVMLVSNVQEATLSWLFRTKDILEKKSDSIHLQVIFADLSLLHPKLHVPIKLTHDGHHVVLVVAAPYYDPALLIPGHLGCEHTGLHLL